jgi:hypothetical protein
VWLYETGQRKDAVIYKNLYGISFSLLIKWRDIPEVVDVCGFHASLKSCKVELANLTVILLLVFWYTVVN